MDGVAFKKTFSYAGFEQQPKLFNNPKILCLNIELELKAEKDNAEIRLKEPEVLVIIRFFSFLLFFILCTYLTKCCIFVLLAISIHCGCGVGNYL